MEEITFRTLEAKGFGLVSPINNRGYEYLSNKKGDVLVFVCECADLLRYIHEHRIKGKSFEHFLQDSFEKYLEVLAENPDEELKAFFVEHKKELSELSGMTPGFRTLLNEVCFNA